MAKKIEWLDKFANDQYQKMTKTASQQKIANQIIVDRSTYPNAKVGSLVDYDNNKYKIVDTKYRDKAGPGLLLEEVACGDGPACTGEVKTTNGVVPATTEVKTSATKTAAKNNTDFDFDALADFDDSKFDKDAGTKFDSFDDDDLSDINFEEEKDTTPALTGNVGTSEYPDIITRPGGEKPIASADIEGPGKKRLTDPPYHPTYDPGEKYALESLDEWQTAADRTAKAIQQEDEQDRTTVEGHYTWNQYIDAILDEEPTKAINNIDEPIPADEDSIDDFDADDELSRDDSDITEEDDVDTAVDNMLELDDEELPEDDSTIEDDDSFDENSSSDEDFSSEYDNEDIPLDFSSEEDNKKFENDEDFSLEDNDESIPADDSFKDNDFEDDSFKDDDLPDDTSLEDEDFSLDEDDEDKHIASPQFKNKQLSRLAFKN